MILFTYSIIFKTSTKVKEIIAQDMYEKGSYTCFLLENNNVVRYPTSNIHSITDIYGKHSDEL